MIRKGLRPGFKVGTGIMNGADGYRRVWRFRRSWVAIAILAAMDAAFLVPTFTTLNQVSSSFGEFNSLFDLVGIVFMSAWLLGWSMAPLIMTSILVLMLFGREVLLLRPGRVELILGLPFLGLSAVYDVAKMRNLRLETPEKKSGSSWRGTHLVFDYGANSVAFGSDVSAEELTEVRNSIHMISGKAVRRGEALPEELEPQWEPEPEARPEPAAVAPLAAEPGPAVISTGPLTLASPSTLLLIIANLVPVVGAAFFGWKLSDVMVLYWAESAVIGFFNVCKIILIGRWFALVAVPFFIGHFGGFMAVHFLFIYVLFVKGVAGMNDSAGDLADVAALFVALWPALLALFISHAYSFFSNFFGQDEYRNRTVSNQMSEPYSRIIFMHLVLILGGGLSMVLGQAGPVIIVVIGLKIFFDVRAHLKEHNKSLPAQEPADRSEDSSGA
jgi:hypothetical protein